jgi:starvation-inducible DNA-binding protein
MEALIQTLRTLQADAFIYYTKAHGYHWNVEGILFDQFHEMFSEVYNDAWSSIDDYAEWVRIFGEKAAFDVTTALSTSNIKYDIPDNSNNPIEMLQSLVSSNDQIISDLKAAFIIANDSNEQGVADFIAGRLSSHQKWSWKFAATLKTMVNG